MLVDPAVARLKAEVPDLSGRVDTALQLAEMIGQKKLPRHTPAAFVVPIGQRGGQSDTASGVFTQMIEHLIAVVLVARDQTPDGRRALAAFDTLLDAVIAAIARWAPGDEIGVFRFISGRTISTAGGAVVHQLDFFISDQLSILSRPTNFPLAAAAISARPTAHWCPTPRRTSQPPKAGQTPGTARRHPRNPPQKPPRNPP